MNWTEDSVSKLKKLYEDGLTYMEIADELETTKGCVSGKLSRLKLVSKTTRKRSIVINKERNKSKLTEELLNLKGMTHKNILELKKDECRYPTKEKNDKFAFCGRHAENGVYCKEHNALCRRPVPKRKADSNFIVVTKKAIAT